MMSGTERFLTLIVPSPKWRRWQGDSHHAGILIGGLHTLDHHSKDPGDHERICALAFAEHSVSHRTEQSKALEKWGGGQ